MSRPQDIPHELDVIPTEAPAGLATRATAKEQAVVAREMQQIQAMALMAMNRPRNVGECLKEIEAACDAPIVAEKALYSYPRGGQTVSGPSIRLAEVIAQSWGNNLYGYTVADQRASASDVVAYFWDLQKNTMKRIEWTVPHIRESNETAWNKETRKYERTGKVNVKHLTDSRDVYELVANMSSRRVRNCILAGIPKWIEQAAVERCKETLKKSFSKEKLADIVKSFDGLDVTVDDLERRLGKKINAINATEYLGLRQIYQSIRDGVSKAEEWFVQAHKPEKIRTETAAAAAEAPAEPAQPSQRATVDARKEFDRAYKAVKDEGVPDPLTILNVKTVEGMTPAQLGAAADKLDAWLEKQRNPS